MKKNKIIFKFIALALIQAFLVMDFAFCGANEVFAKEKNNLTSTLAPKININADSFRNIFSEGIKFQGEKQGLTPRPNREANSKDEKPISAKNLKNVIATGFLFANMVLGSMNALADAAMTPPGVSLIQKTETTIPSDLQKIKGKTVATKKKLDISAQPGPVDTTPIYTGFKKRELDFNTSQAQKRVKEINAWIEQIWEEYSKTNKLDEYEFITKRGDSPEAVAIGKALLLMQKFDPQAYEALKTRNASIYVGSIQGAGATTGSRFLGLTGKPIIYVNKQYLNNPFWVSDILVHESTHARRLARNVFYLPLKHNLFTFIRNWIFAEEYEEEKAFIAETRYLGKFGFKPQKGKTVFFDSFEVLGPYYHARWANLALDLIGAIIFNVIPLLICWNILKEKFRDGSGRRGGGNYYRRNRFRAIILLPLADLLGQVLNPPHLLAATGMGMVTGISVFSSFVIPAFMGLAVGIIWRGFKDNKKNTKKASDQGQRIETSSSYAEFNLNRYSDDELLERARDYLKEVVINSPVKKDVFFHDPKHWNDLLEFMESVFNNPTLKIFKDAQEKEEFLRLVRLAGYFHDVGYYIPVEGKFTKNGHEKRSDEELTKFIEFIEKNYSHLKPDLSKKEAMSYLIRWTEFILGEKVIQETDLVNKILLELEQVKNKQREKLSEKAREYLKEKLPNLGIDSPLDLEKKVSFAFNALFAGKVIAVADIYSHANDQVTKIPGLWYEFNLDKIASPTILEQIAGSYDFLVKVTVSQRLKYLYKQKYGVYKFIPRALKKDRRINLLTMKHIRYLVNKLKYYSFTQENKEELIKLIDGLNIKTDVDKFKDRMKQEIDIIMKRNGDRSRICDLPNRQRFVEDLVESLDSGKRVQVAFLNIQNFKEEFNDRGAKLNELAKEYPLDKINIVGHEFGDFGIQATAQYLPQLLQKLLENTEITFKVYNDAKSYWIIFENVPVDFKISEIFKELFKDNSEFKNAVVGEVKTRTERRIQRLENSGELDKEKAKNVRTELEKFSWKKFNIYGGISDIFSLKQTTSNLDAVLAANRLDTRVMFTAKLAQIGLSGEDLRKLYAENKDKPEILRRIISQYIEKGKKAQETRLRTYAEEIEKDVSIHREYGQKGEFESMYRPVRLVYESESTYKKLSAAYEEALTAKDQARIKRAKEELFGKMVTYQLEPTIAERVKGLIFVGNERFKDIINYIILTRPEKDWSGTFKIGGDEFGKIVWKAKTGELFIFRFDINNLGNLNSQWGVKIGDKLIDEMSRLFDEIDEIDEPYKYMSYIYNFFNNTNLESKNLKDNPWKLEKEEYDYLAKKMEEKGKEPSGYLMIKDEKYYLKQVPPVLVEVEDEITKEKISYETGPAVSVGVVKVNTNLIYQKKEKGANIYRNFSVIQGRADNVAEAVKKRLKEFQLEHNGIITDNFFKSDEIKAEMIADAYQVNALRRFKPTELSVLSKELAEFIINAKKQKEPIFTQQEESINSLNIPIGHRKTERDSLELETVENSI